ncbi:hypothetical protein BDR07DRAFT_1386380 [Suillus spraguei]|nr:hypothetical protein BDR07DRAFT_1386380 [Suillus spraguei]
MSPGTGTLNVWIWGIESWLSMSLGTGAFDFGYWGLFLAIHVPRDWSLYLRSGGYTSLIFPCFLYHFLFHHSLVILSWQLAGSSLHEKGGNHPWANQGRMSRV